MGEDELFFQPIEVSKEDDSKRKIPDINFDDLSEINNSSVFTPIIKEESIDNDDTKVEIPLKERLENVKSGLNNPKKKKEVFKKLVLIDKNKYDLIRRLALFDIKSENQLVNEALALYLEKRKKDVNKIKDIS